MTSKAVGTDTTTYEYNYENRLIKITYPDTSTNTFEYDGRGKRIKKVDSSGTNKYLYDGLNVLVEYDGAGSLKARYIQSLEVDRPISMTRGGITSFYHFDEIGSVTALTDTNQNVMGTYTYDAFGNIIAQTGTTENPYRFTARELDSDSGLMYYRSRYYYPAIGRFITQDPLRGGIYDPLSLNRYLYVKNNPVNWIDPEGESLLLAAGIVGAALAVYGLYKYIRKATETICEKPEFPEQGKEESDEDYIERVEKWYDERADWWQEDIPELHDSAGGVAGTSAKPPLPSKSQ